MASQIRIRRLFTELDTFGKNLEKRNYVKNEMIRMIQDNDFCLTECMNQRYDAVQHLGDVILGHGIDDGTMMGEAGRHITTFHIPQEIRDHEIEIESVCGETIKYINGMREVEGLILGSGPRKQNIPRFEKEVIDTKQTKTKLKLREAFLCLKKFGKYIVHAENANEKSIYWKYVEINDALQQEKKTTSKKNKEVEVRV